MRVPWLVAAWGLASLALVGCATVEIRETRILEGRVTNDAGQPVANSPVVVLGRSLNLVKARLEYREAAQQAARAVTDADGRYRLEFIPSTIGNNFYLFFYDRTGFDAVRYRRPEPIEITDLLKRDTRVVVNQALLPAATWPEVSREIAFFGEASDRGRILRRHGLPEKRETSPGLGGPDAEVWWYYSDGVSYWFQEDRLIRTHTFAPNTLGPPRQP
jgi:hypothetical protein